MAGETIQSCGTCRFRLPSGDVKTGICRRHPPQVILMPGKTVLGQPMMQLVAMWPSVPNDGGCADGASVAEIVPLRPAVASTPALEYAGGPLTLGDGN